MNLLHIRRMHMEWTGVATKTLEWFLGFHLSVIWLYKKNGRWFCNLCLNCHKLLRLLRSVVYKTTQTVSTQSSWAKIISRGNHGYRHFFFRAGGQVWWAGWKACIWSVKVDRSFWQLRVEENFDSLPRLNKRQVFAFASVVPHSCCPFPCVHVSPAVASLLRFQRRSVATESAMPPLKVSSQTRGGSFGKPCGCTFQSIWTSPTYLL